MSFKSTLLAIILLTAASGASARADEQNFIFYIDGNSGVMVPGSITHDKLNGDEEKCRYLFNVLKSIKKNIYGKSTVEACKLTVDKKEYEPLICTEYVYNLKAWDIKADTGCAFETVAFPPLFRIVHSVEYALLFPEILASDDLIHTADGIVSAKDFRKKNYVSHLRKKLSAGDYTCDTLKAYASLSDDPKFFFSLFETDRKNCAVMALAAHAPKIDSVLFETLLKNIETTDNESVLRYILSFSSDERTVAHAVKRLLTLRPDENPETWGAKKDVFEKALARLSSDLQDFSEENIRKIMNPSKDWKALSANLHPASRLSPKMRQELALRLLRHAREADVRAVALFALLRDDAARYEKSAVHLLSLLPPEKIIDAIFDNFEYLSPGAAFDILTLLSEMPPDLLLYAKNQRKFPVPFVIALRFALENDPARKNIAEKDKDLKLLLSTDRRVREDASPDGQLREAFRVREDAFDSPGLKNALSSKIASLAALFSMKNRRALSPEEAKIYVKIAQVSANPVPFLKLLPRLVNDANARVFVSFCAELLFLNAADVQIAALEALSEISQSPALSPEFVKEAEDAPSLSLKDPKESVRRRALVIAACAQKNGQAVADELAEHPEFKDILLENACRCRYAPDVEATLSARSSQNMWRKLCEP